MPVQTTIGQECNSRYNSAGKLKFFIRTSVDYVKPGDLPFDDVFVHKIVVENDPKSDKFQRVGNVIDLTTLLHGRDAALAAGQSLYLSAAFEVEYDDVATATVAKNAIVARVDDLISQWVTYTTKFQVPSSYALPPIDSTLVKSAKAAFKNAKSARGEKEKALADANTALLAAEKDASTAKDALVDATALSIDCSQNLALLNSGVQAATGLNLVTKNLITAIEGFLTQVDTYQTEHAVSGSDYVVSGANYSTFVAALTAVKNSLRNTGGLEPQAAQKERDLAALTAAQTAVSDECSDVLAAVTTKAQAKTLVDAAYGTAQTKQSLAQADADAAKAAEEAALATLKAICPDFDPDAV